VIVWDGATGSALGTLVAGTFFAPTVSVFLDYGHTIATGTADGAVQFWDVRPEHSVEFACSVAGRSLSVNEWRDAFGDRAYRETCPD
jgi:WD40 repeat protein